METLESAITGAGEKQDQNKKDELDIKNFESDLRSYELSHRTAIEKRDIEEILQFYAADLIIIPQGEPNIYGRDQLKNLLADLLKTYDLFEDFKFGDFRVTGDRITASYTFEQKLTPLSGGDMIYRTGKGLCILKRSGTGNWQSEWNSYNYDEIPETGNGQTATVDIEKEKAVVLGKLDQWFRAIEVKDAEILEGIISNDTDLVFFGTDSQERWMGKDDFISAQKEFFNATSDSRIKIYNKTIQLSQSGTVAWTSCMMNWDILSGDQPIHLEGLRLTLTFEKRNENWVIVQGHGSVPVSGQMIAY
jgi:ketosteroid isomerase-like protein